MSRLPIPGGDVGKWGEILNNFLRVSLNSDGTLKKSADIEQAKADAIAALGGLNDKVDKVSGKGLSTEDYSTVDKNKLAGIADGAEVNVNADWSAGSGDAQILNKPSLATVATSGSYTDLSNKPTIPAAQINSDWSSVSGVSQILNKPTIPTKTSDLANDSSFITSAGAPVQSVAGKTGTVTLVKGDVGLGNVDNTSDLSKPISTATQSALDAKLDDTQLDTDGTLTANSDTKIASQKATKTYVDTNKGDKLPNQSGNGGKYLKTDGSSASWDTLSAGDVVGPASSTDNAITRFDGTTGKTVQGSTVTLADNGQITNNTNIVWTNQHTAGGPFVANNSGAGSDTSVSNYQGFKGSTETFRVTHGGDIYARSVGVFGGLPKLTFISGSRINYNGDIWMEKNGGYIQFRSPNGSSHSVSLGNDKTFNMGIGKIAASWTAAATEIAVKSPNGSVRTAINSLGDMYINVNNQNAFNSADFGATVPLTVRHSNEGTPSGDLVYFKIGSNDLYHHTKAGTTQVQARPSQTVNLSEWLNSSGTAMNIIKATGDMAIGTNSMHASAKFQVDSTSQGVLPPRMTTTQKNAISSPAEGLMVYDLTLHKMSYYDGTSWNNI